jgi:nitrite reductase/ring-hydroxylating ferredoxin subunit
MADKKRLKQFDERRSKSSCHPNSQSEGEGATAEGARLVCDSCELAERGDGVRFELDCDGETVPAFAIRHGGRVYAYINRCAHIAMELDWKQGKFFDADGEYLICSTHGALYAPESGACRGGPCRGAKLAALDVFEADGKVYMKMKG